MTTMTTADFDVMGLTTEVAHYLGDGWAALPDRFASDEDGRQRTTHPRLQHGTGPHLYVVHGGYQKEGRITISVDWPIDPVTHESYHPHARLSRSDYEDATTSITVADTKTAKQIAADIARRLLPDATRLWTLILAAMDNATRYRNATDANLRRIAAETGSEYRPARDGHRENGSVHVAP